MSLRLTLFNAADFINKSRFSSLGLAYIASYLRKYSDFREIYIIESNGMANIKRIKPDVVGIYSVTQTFEEACKLARLIKLEYKNIPIIIGGYHISALPNILPDCFDVGVLGEGEETMKELITVINKYGVRSEKLREIKGIVFRDEGRVVVNQARGFINNIDSIPFPARDLISNTRFSSIITSRGCPYGCIFCSSVKFWGKPRFHSAGYVVDEMEEIIAKHKAIHISIWDDLFIADRARLEAIANLIQKRKINKKVSFGCALRSNLINEELCSLLKKINVNRISIGFESGSQKILDYLKCGSVSVEQHVKAVELCKSHRFYTTGTFMIGSPGEDIQDLEKTLELMKRLKLDGGGNISITTPLPGTELWDYARQNNIISNDLDATRLGIMAADFSDIKGFNGILLTDKISKEDFFNMAQRLQKETNKYYIKGLLRWRNMSFKNLRFILSRPKEFIAVLKFIFKSLLRKASIMDRYVYYYKKMGK